jgi:hypothetical protein
MILTLMLAASAAAAPVREIQCSLMEQQGRETVTVEAPDLHVLQQTGQGQRFQPTLTRGTAAVLCGRTGIIPAAHDDEVLALGVPLYISEAGGSRRLGLLEIDNGQYRYRMIHGTLSADEAPLLQSRIAEFQARIAAAARR